MPANQEFFQPIIKASPHYAAIMEDFDKHAHRMGHVDFWRQFVQPRDPDIKKATWSTFSRKEKKKREKQKSNPATVPTSSSLAEVHVQSNDFETDETTLKKLQENSIEYMMKIGVGALKELADDTEAAKRVPIKDRMNMLRDAIKLKNDMEALELKRNKDNRDQSMFEEMMEAAQYGDVEESEIIDAEIEEEPDEQLQLEQAKEPLHVEILSSIVFDPSQL